MECTCHLNAPCKYCIEKEKCEACGKLFHPDNEGDKFINTGDGYRFWLCDECIEAGDYY